MALKSPVQDPSAPGPQHSGPGKDGGREGGPGFPWLPCPAVPTPPYHPPCTHPTSCSAVRFTIALWDPNGFHCGPTPTQVGGGAGQGPGHPHRCPCPQATMFLLFRCVSPASSRLPRSSSSPCPPCSLFHSSPTNLSWPLSPLLPPSAPHRDVPGPAAGPCASPSASLCTRLSVSLCPVTSGSFRGADHLLPGCFAAVLMLWCGQNNSDLIPSAVNLALSSRPSIFNLTLPLQLFQSPLPPVPVCVSTCCQVCDPVCVCM